jgi:hypothetical protein
MDADGIWRRYVRYIGAGAVATGGLLTVLRNLPTMVGAFAAVIVTTVVMLFFQVTVRIDHYSASPKNAITARGSWRAHLAVGSDRAIASARNSLRGAVMVTARHVE